VTVKHAERINGLRYVVLAKPKGRFYVEAFDGDIMIANAEEFTLSKTLDIIVNTVYRINSRQKMVEQDWKCALCGKRNPLEIDHHPISRARGQRDDRPQNLRAVCTVYGCGLHAKKHGG